MRYKPERALKLHRFAQQQVESLVTTQAREGIETVVQVPERPSLA